MCETCDRKKSPRIGEWMIEFVRPSTARRLLSFLIIDEVGRHEVDPLGTKHRDVKHTTQSIKDTVILVLLV